MPTPTEDGVYANVTDVDYHGDRGSLSSTGARQILWDTPAKFNAPKPEPTRTLDFGHVAHRLILGKGAEFVVLDPAVHGLKSDGTPADNPRATAAWKRADAEARAADLVPIHIDDHRAAEAMARAVAEHPLAGPLFAVGDPEISGYWTDEPTGVRLRWRADWLHPGRNRLIIVDYKTAKSASPAGFSKSVGEYRYHQQAAWYIDGVIAAEIDPDPLFLFVAQEKTPPYLVSVHECKPWQIERGRALNRQAIDLYAQCRETNTWPGYAAVIHSVEFPAYINYREEELLSR